MEDLLDSRKDLRKTLLWITIFSVAMSYMESAVVVYLRELYFPNGFAFPLAPIGREIAITEFFREVATIFMLLAAAYVAGRTAWTRFAWFLWCFGIWDIFYYVWLKVLIDWPSSLMEWDILFLVPIPWTGPVLAPILVSLSIMSFGLIILWKAQIEELRISRMQLLILMLGALIIVISFCLDNFKFAIENGLLGELFTIPGKGELLFGTTANYMPNRFYWWVFLLGEAFSGSVVVSMLMRRRSNRIV